ncbi:hypothetical protein Gotri_016042 [Gossypium trilobum]|uniref:Reticulon-like protein n=1 Tax=Gossypium trilobum TaxID=34281 RepID=A0A7J9E260_9ROSI|nr:hypothetical protein [Gossypium trilobum]
MPIYDSSSESDNEITPRGKLFGRQRPMHAILGGGKGILSISLFTYPYIFTTFVFGNKVVEYNFVTLLCHISITAMLAIFIWCISADYFGWKRPTIPQLLSDQAAFSEVVYFFHWRFNQFLQKLLHIAGGNDPVNFFLVIISLYVLSVIGSCFDFVNLLFIGLVSMETLPYLYTRYEDEVDYHAGQMTRKGSKVYKRFLNKIPRGTVKEKKHS